MKTFFRLIVFSVLLQFGTIQYFERKITLKTFDILPNLVISTTKYFQPPTSVVVVLLLTIVLYMQKKFDPGVTFLVLSKVSFLVAATCLLLQCFHRYNLQF